jgi:outer membrane cobalamin receptor
MVRQCVLLLLVVAGPVDAADIIGTVRDETGATLPGVLVELGPSDGGPRTATTDGQGHYRFEAVPDGRAELTFSLVNFAPARREVAVSASSVRIDAVLHLALSAEVLVTGMRTFVNLADVEDPSRSLIGIAQSASQGAVTARQLEARPLTRSGEVLETVPGVIISQHSGEGKANQYYLRGFNLDHGTDFATTVAGMPANMPTHGHGHGYSDLSFLIPELVSGIQFSKGPYFADQGDFATAGAANINYVNALERPIVQVDVGQDGYARALVAASQRVAVGTWLGAAEVFHNDGPWDRPDDYRKLNGMLRFTRGDAANGFSITGMAYRGEWDATDQVPTRAVAGGVIGRFGNLDPSDGGRSYRVSGSFDWQRTRDSVSTKLTGYGIAYGLDLYSNFTFFLDDPVNGDQFHQADRRLVTGLRLAQRRHSRWRGRLMQSTFGAQLRNDNISTVGLYHTRERERLEAVREDAVLQTSGAVFAQNETEWSPRVRTLAGIRVDGYRFDVDALDPENGGTRNTGIASPKGGIIVGPFSGTEFYANAGLGFHSNDARGATITRDPATGEPADPVTPLARARGAEVGMRTVAVPGLQTTLSLWTLHLASELVFVGDAGTTDVGRPSHRHGVELANYVRPRPWLTFEVDLSWSHGHFTDDDPAGDHIPGAVKTVASGGATVDDISGWFGSARVRHFGPRPLVEDDSVRSRATTLVNLGVGYKVTPRVRVVVDVFNLFDAEDSDVDYLYASRLPGEPADGVTEIHFHPTLPRTARIGLRVVF